LGPLLFNVYVADLLYALSSLTSSISTVYFHMYADDLLVYTPFTPLDMVDSLASLQKALDLIEEWTHENYLLLSPSKTTARVIHLPKALPVVLHPLTLGGSQLDVLYSNSLKWLGVELDASLTMKAFVVNTCKSCFMQLMMIRSIRNSLDEPSTLLLCNALVLSRLDYANSLLVSADASLLQNLRRVLHLAARTVKRLPRGEHISPALKELRWCPADRRPEWKLVCLIYKSLLGNAPDYLAENLKVYIPRRSLRSSNADHVTFELVSSRIKCGEGAFRVAGPRKWNALPINLRVPNTTVASFSEKVVQLFLS
jgi:hypothetical protein